MRTVTLSQAVRYTTIIKKNITMKKLLFGLFTIASLHTFAQPWETIKGNGQVKKETREVSAFASLLSRGSMNVEISYGNSNKITVEADENLLPYIETTVEDGKLTIKSKNHVNIKTNSKTTFQYLNIYLRNMMKKNQLSLTFPIE